MASAFIGRSAELERLEKAPPGSIVTLWGAGGVGKTRLAREHSQREQRRGRAVLWTDLAGSRTRREVVAAIATALGVATDIEIIDALGRAAAAQGALVVLDNLEQLDEDARKAIVTFAGAVRREPGGAAIVATSREVTGAEGEIALPLAPLSDEDALTLFEALSGGADTNADQRAIARSIVRRLDALPLAIELAAARVPLLGVAELSARLDRKLDVLGTAKGDRPARHATLRAAIAWSWELLEHEERDALMACATFEAPFDAALAEAVIGAGEVDALDRLERLRARALVHATTDDGRTTLRLLESVRDFAREMDAERAARSSRHAAAVADASEPLADAARCGRNSWAALERMRGDLVVAASAPGPSQARAALALAALLAISGPADAAVSSIDAALVGCTAQDRVSLLVAKGDALRALGRLEEARDVLSSAITESAVTEGALSEASDLGDAPSLRLAGAEARRIRGSALRGLGHIDEALAEKQAALATYRAIGDRAREGICLGEIGAVHQSQGRLAVAKKFHAEAIAIHTETGARRAEGVERSYLAVATHRAGDPAASIALHEAALVIHREVGHKRLEGAELLHLGFVHHELGGLSEARAAFETARKLLVAAGARGLEAMALVLFARLEVDAGDPVAALLRLAEAAQVAPASWPRVAATRHLVEGHMAMRAHAFADARTSYEAALATSRDPEVGFEALTPAYLAVAIAKEGEGAGARAESHLEDARRAVAALENPHLRAAFDVLAAIARGSTVPEHAAASSPVSSEVRRALALSSAPRALVIEDEAKRAVMPDGRAVDLSRRKNVRLVLLALAHARRDSPGAVVTPDALVEAGWPGERMRGDAATKRLHTAIWTLRTLGFEAVLLTEGDGYLLDPRVDLRLSCP